MKYGYTDVRLHGGSDRVGLSFDVVTGLFEGSLLGVGLWGKEINDRDMCRDDGTEIPLRQSLPCR